MIAIKLRITAACLSVLALALLGASDAFMPVQSLANQRQQRVSSITFSSPNDDGKEPPKPEKENVASVEEDDANVLTRLNSLLDTPILDANNKQDQGPFAEALKEFVRDDAELASLVFSVVVVVLMAAGTRGAMYLINGY